MKKKGSGPSTQPRKQRRALFQAPIHRRRKEISAHLSEDLMVQFNRRSVPLRKGDQIEVVRGDFKGTSSEVLRVDRKRLLIEAENVTIRKSDGTEVVRPIHASNVIVTKLDLTDPKRRAMLERKGVEVKAEPKPAKKPAKKAAKKEEPAAAEEANEGDDADEGDEGPDVEPEPKGDAAPAPVETDPRAKEESSAIPDEEKTTEKEGSA